jgi:hypothetical protein
MRLASTRPTDLYEMLLSFARSGRREAYGRAGTGRLRPPYTTTSSPIRIRRVGHLTKDGQLT